jgi:hypothetical protein
MIDNAFRYGEGKVRLLAVDKDEAVELHVGDRGAGFPTAFLPHAFERFSRADPARTRAAAGSAWRSSRRSLERTEDVPVPSMTPEAARMSGSRFPSPDCGPTVELSPPFHPPSVEKAHNPNSRRTR